MFVCLCYYATKRATRLGLLIHSLKAVQVQVLKLSVRSVGGAGPHQHQWRLVRDDAVTPSPSTACAQRVAQITLIVIQYIVINKWFNQQSHFTG